MASIGVGAALANGPLFQERIGPFDFFFLLMMG